MSKPPNNATDTPQPCCPDCGEVLDRKGICWYCYDQEYAIDHPDPDAFEEQSRYAEQRKAYRNGRWIVDGFMRTGSSEADAITKAETPENIHFALELEGFYALVDILADRWATEALRQLILAGDKETLRVLSECPEGGLFYPAPRRGPRPKGDDHREHAVLRLKRAGKTNGQIAKLLGIKKSTVAAAYNNITKKIAKRQANPPLLVEELRKKPGNNSRS